jgi:hypothetical protein
MSKRVKPWGSAWVDNKVRHFREYRILKKGKLKGYYVIEVPIGQKLVRTRYKTVFRKYTVPPDAIKHLPEDMIQIKERGKTLWQLKADVDAATAKSAGCT